jgi:hypothetical protein
LGAEQVFLVHLVTREKKVIGSDPAKIKHGCRCAKNNSVCIVCTIIQGCQIIFSPTNQNLEKNKPNGRKTNQISDEKKPKTNHFVTNE